MNNQKFFVLNRSIKGRIENFRQHFLLFKKLIIKVSKIVNKIDYSNTKIICSNTKNMILTINIIIVDFIDFFDFKNILKTLTQLKKTLTQNNYVNCVREF